MNARAARMERRLQWPVLVAALLVLPLIVVEQASPAEPWRTIAAVLNWTTWLLFLAEVILMLAVVDDRWRWLRDNPLDLAIVILTPPVLPASLQAARAFRVFRVLRLVKAATLTRRLLSTEGLRSETRP